MSALLTHPHTGFIRGILIPSGVFPSCPARCGAEGKASLLIVSFLPAGENLSVRKIRDL